MLLGAFSKSRRKTPTYENKWGFVASEGFEPPKAEPADLQLSDERLVVGQNGNVPQYFIGQAT